MKSITSQRGDRQAANEAVASGAIANGQNQNLDVLQIDLAVGKKCAVCKLIKATDQLSEDKRCH